jgi:hypothetical protein
MENVVKMREEGKGLFAVKIKPFQSPIGRLATKSKRCLI